MEEGILTGEGVLLDTRPAGFASRMLGALIDLAALAAVVTGILLVAGALTTGVDYTARIVTVVGMAVVMVGVPTTVETLTRGRSLGKLAMGIRIVRDDGGPITLRHALVRALVGIVELWLTAGVVAIITSMVHPQGKRLGDMVAGTYAARVRGRTTTTRAIEMPPYLAVWAAGADVARLPDGLALAVRQFLGRAARLHPASRVELGTRLTEQVQALVRPLPPPGTHPEDFLAAVLAERRSRELAAEQRRAARAAADAALLTRLPHGVPDPAD
jgi:uncharacterized RDD family membrane protein YckC